MSSPPATTLASTTKHSNWKRAMAASRARGGKNAGLISVVPTPKAGTLTAATSAAAPTSLPTAPVGLAPTAAIGTLAVGQAVFYHDPAFKTWLLGTVVVADASGIDVEPANGPDQLKTIQFNEVEKKPFAAVPGTSQYNSRNLSLNQFLATCTDAKLVSALRKFRDELENNESDLTDLSDSDDGLSATMVPATPRPAKKRKAESLLDASQSDEPNSSQVASIMSSGRQLTRATARKKAKVAPPTIIDVSDSESSSSSSSEEDPANDSDFEDGPAKSRRKKSTTKSKTPKKTTPSKRTTTKTAATSPSPKVVKFTKRARHDPSSSAPTGLMGPLGPPATLDRPTTLDTSSESSDDDHGPTAADPTLRPGDSVLALDPTLNAYVPARVITQSATELTVHLYRGLVELSLPRTQIRVFGDRDFGRVPLAPMGPPRIDFTYRNPVLERRVLSMVPALDEIVKGVRASWRHATWCRGGRVAHRELARATGGNPYSPDEAALVERMLKARYLDGFDVDEEEARGDVVMADLAAVETASKFKSKRKKTKATATPAMAKKPTVPAAKVPVTVVSSPRAAKNKASYVELSDEEEDDDGDFVQPRPGPSSSSVRKAAPARAPTAPPTIPLQPRATVFAAGPDDVRTSESAYIQLVLVPECKLRLLCLTHLHPLTPTSARTDGVSSRISSTHAADGHDSDTSSLSTVKSGYASSDNDNDAARVGALPQFMRHYLCQLDVGSAKWNNPATASASDAWLEYSLLAEDEVSVLPQAEMLLKDAHWVAGLLELYRSSRGK
ncbi:hypothetical protein AMAG_04308 [Allomyces macrogynus ATCC 38327]|uniref:Uncharacterized protein n=1 Tax=Allomyces macrogynus (strain ATCC 38327) TaxID=578462 RepID=A0A0L0S8N5_ALLM3|nr:hypothetical protein AMAG_04308 [Allomyces macrogynus ATCC 38327]|eukprot:KNE58754.1 hypothetical protein AMAG_04308 [Allomyces macrogynus ATCC 38327]